MIYCDFLGAKLHFCEKIMQKGANHTPLAGWGEFAK